MNITRVAWSSFRESLAWLWTPSFPASERAGAWRERPIKRSWGMPFASALLAAALAASAASSPDREGGHATVLVLPFTLQGEGSEWTGLAVAESVIDFVAQVNQDNFITVKQLDAALRPRGIKINDGAAITAAAQELGRTLGATDVITGEVSRKGDLFIIDARRLRVGSASVVKQSKVQGPRAVLPLLTKKLASELAGATTKAPPLSKDQRALEEAAACTGILARQSLSPQAKGTLDEAVLAEAEKHCREALTIDPALGLARAGLAVVLACRGDFDSAKKEAQAARAKRFVPLAVLAESFALRRAGDVNGSRAVLDDAVASRPGFLHALGYLGEDRLESRDNASAKVEFERYLKRAPGHPWATAQLAHALSRLGKKDEALKLTQEAIAKNPTDPELSIELASRLIDLGKDVQAEPFLKSALEANPPRILAGLRLGFLQLRGKRLKEARESFTKVASLATGTDESRVRAVAQADLARVSAAEGNYDEAIQHLTAAKEEGMRKLPCDEASFAQWKGKPEMDEACKEPENGKFDAFDENESAAIDF